MKKAFMVFTVMMSTVIFSSAVFAAAWNVPTNVRVVQKSNTDTTGRIYSNIQTAINSITTASATNPYVVKVMPGIYDLGTASLQMKEYVDLEGSGPENTVIQSSNANSEPYICTAGTVLMVSNSVIRNIKVVNIPPANSGYVNVSALVFDNVKAKAEGISVLSGSGTIEGGINNGISICGASAHATLNNVSIEAHNSAVGRCNAAYLIRDGSLTLTNSKLTGSCGDLSGINSDSGANIGILTVMNSSIEVATPGGTGIFAAGYKTSVSNSSINLNVGTSSGFYTTTDFLMINSKIASDSTPTYYAEYPGQVKIANSLLTGGSAGLAGTKLINNYDENFTAIPNQ